MLRFLLLAFAATAMGFAVTPAVPRISQVAVRAAPATMNFFDDMKKGLVKLQAGSYDEAEVKARVERQIKMKPCIMFATSTCPFCETARKEMRAMGTVFTEIDLDEEDDGMAIKAELAGITGQTSVPQVFVGGKFIGGCNDGGMGGVVPLKQSGKLEEMLVAAGALVPGARI